MATENSLNVIDTFKKIQATSGVNDKIKIISENKENQRFLRWIRFLLDPAVKTGISDKKIQKPLDPPTELSPFYLSTCSDFDDVIDYLKKNSTGTDEDIYEVQCFLSGQGEKREFFEQMITRTFRLGVDVKTVNKAIPGLIASWEVQQAFPVSEKNIPKHGQWFQLSQKLNGVNAGYLDGDLISRQGKVFQGLEHIISDIQKLPFKNMFFNGELIRKNPDGLSDNDNFKLGTGIINSDNKDKTSIKFVIYEMFPEDEFLLGQSKLQYRDRRKTYLDPLTEEIKNLQLENIEVVPPVYQGTDLEEIGIQLDKANATGWEGLMLNKDSKWQAKRNNGILKVKSFKNCDLLCTGVYEGTGKNKGVLGGVYCDYKGFQLGVGSGFTDEQRREYWEHPDQIVGKIVQIKYKEETQNKKGGLSVQFPIFQFIRDDKTVPSYQ